MMNLSDLDELKQLAMLAELARPLTHECNNFLNNLLLQLAISEKSFPESSRAEWASIRREGKKLANLFQQWQRQRKQPSEGPTKIELNRLIQETVEELRSESPTIQLLVPACDPLCLKGYRGEVQRLLCLLLRYAIAAVQSSGGEDPAIEINLGKDNNRIILRLRRPGKAAGKLLWTDFNDLASSERVALSLPALTCKSLIERLDGDIRIEQEANGSLVLVVDLPLAV